MGSLPWLQPPPRNSPQSFCPPPWPEAEAESLEELRLTQENSPIRLLSLEEELEAPCCAEDPWSPLTESSLPDIAVMDNLPADWESELEATTYTKTIPTRPTSPSTPSPTTRTTTPGLSRTTSACSGSPTAPT